MAKKGINKVTLIGILGNDPEVRATKTGECVVNFSIATGETWKTDGVVQESTEWHQIAAFGKLAEIIRDYVRKGSKVYIDGSIRYRKWTDSDGQIKYATNIVASEIQILDKRENDGNAQPQRHQPQQAPQRREANGNRVDSRQAAPIDYDDDIPF